MDHTVDLVVRFSDLDPLGHLNNVAAVTMLETGRVEFSHDLGLMDGAVSTFVLAALHIDFRSQAFYRDELRVVTETAKLGRTSFTLRQRLWRPADEATIAESEAVLVVLGDDRRTPAPIPDRWRERLTAAG